VSADRTFVTEVATGLGMVGGTDVEVTIAERPPQLANLTALEWDRLDALWATGELRADFEHGFANGRAFLAAPDALNGRPPRIVEWTGPRRAPGDEVVPADLRVDHVYLVSCKYLSMVLHNSSPQRLVEGLLGRGTLEERGDWYQAVAPQEHQALYAACVAALGTELRPDGDAAPPGADLGGDGDAGWPALASDLDKERRRRLTAALRPWPESAAEPYRRLCQAVSEATAARWSGRITARDREAVLWRLLRIGSAPYFVLGTSAAGPMRLRIDTPWDWRQQFTLRGFEVVPQAGGQPRVAWRGHYEVRATGEERIVEGHVELRWSHGRFGGPPEAKVYLDTPHGEVPGYHPLDACSLDAGSLDGRSLEGRAAAEPRTEAAGSGSGTDGSADGGELTLFSP